MTSDWAAKTIQEELENHGGVRPPWQFMPEVHPYDIGWRMGSGESWRYFWWDWVQSQQWSREERLDYLRRFPAPGPWGASAWAVLEPESDEEEGPVPHAELRRLGVVVEFAAYDAWCPAPGELPNFRPELSKMPFGLTRGLRELCFLARWASKHRDTPLVKQWCSESDPSHPLCVALQTGKVPDGDFGDGETELCLRVAAEGLAPAPWTLGHSADSCSTEGSYADAWQHWVMANFDDPGPWQRYLAQYGVPADWKEFVESISGEIC